MSRTGGKYGAWACTYHRCCTANERDEGPAASEADARHEARVAREQCRGSLSATGSGLSTPESFGLTGGRSARAEIAAFDSESFGVDVASASGVV